MQECSPFRRRKRAFLPPHSDFPLPGSWVRLLSDRDKALLFIECKGRRILLIDAKRQHGVPPLCRIDKGGADAPPAERLCHKEALHLCSREAEKPPHRSRSLLHIHEDLCLRQSSPYRLLVPLPVRGIHKGMGSPISRKPDLHQAVKILLPCLSHHESSSPSLVLSCRRPKKMSFSLISSQVFGPTPGMFRYQRGSRAAAPDRSPTVIIPAAAMAS